MYVQLETEGFRLSAPVEAIWRGERDAAALIQSLDDTDVAVINALLALLTQR